MLRFIQFPVSKTLFYSIVVTPARRQFDSTELGVIPNHRVWIPVRVRVRVGLQDKVRVGIQVKV